MCIILAHYVVRSAVSDYKILWFLLTARQFNAKHASICMLRMYFTKSNAKSLTARCMNCVMLL